MSRRVSKGRARKGERFARLPLRVMESAAAASLSHGEFRVLVLYCAAYNGFNNGSLALTRGQAAAFGIQKTLLMDAQRVLEERGLLVMTQPGSRTPPRPHMFAITWESIDEGKHDCAVTRVGTHAYRSWSDSPTSHVRSEDTAMSAQRTREPKKTTKKAPAMSAQRTRSALSHVRAEDTSKSLVIGKTGIRVDNNE